MGGVRWPTAGVQSQTPIQLKAVIPRGYERLITGFLGTRHQMAVDVMKWGRD
jgi:hypothetical protein